MNKKNVIIIMIDGGRLDNSLKSNFFNKLKSKSVFFSQAITYAPHTIASMHAVFSGSYGTRTGTNSYWSTFNFKKNKFKTLTEYLQEQGYYTHADVINELVLPKQGFDKFIVHDENTDDLTKRHQELLKEMYEKTKTGKNIFLYLHYSNIHTGIMNNVLKVYNNFSKEYFENKEENQKQYDVLFSKAEQYLEQQLNVIENLGFDKNSLILIMSDHGIGVGEKFGERAYGVFCYDYTLRIFAYLMAKDFIPIEIFSQTRSVDLMPTILDYLEIHINKNYEEPDGQSLLPLIKGQQVEEKIAYSETGNPLDKKEPPKEPNISSVRTSEWKLIFNEHNDTTELYNLIEDPLERHNLSNSGLEIENTLLKKLFEIKKGKRL